MHVLVDSVRGEEWVRRQQRIAGGGAEHKAPRWPQAHALHLPSIILPCQSRVPTIVHPDPMFMPGTPDRAAGGPGPRDPAGATSVDASSPGHPPGAAGASPPWVRGAGRLLVEAAHAAASGEASVATGLHPPMMCNTSFGNRTSSFHPIITLAHTVGEEWIGKGGMWWIGGCSPA